VKIYRIRLAWETGQHLEP